MYAKIFSQILDSSIVENPDVRFTFMDLLVLCDQDGVVDMTHEAIARRTNRPLDVIKKTIEILEQPDHRSRTPDNDGRRIVRLDDHRDWGWLIINYAKFRAIASDEQRREKTRDRVQRHRAKRANGNELCDMKRHVTLGNACNAMQKKKEKEIENTYIARGRDDETSDNDLVPPSNSSQYVPTLKDCIDYGVVIGFGAKDATRFFNHFQSVGWKTAGGVRITNWRFKMKNWEVEDKQKRHIGASKYGNKPTVKEPTYSDDDPLFRKRD